MQRTLSWTPNHTSDPVVHMPDAPDAEIDGLSEPQVLYSGYKPGTAVLIEGEIPARILNAVISPGGLHYTVVWWCDGERHQTDVLPEEVSPAPSGPKARIGFIHEQN